MSLVGLKPDVNDLEVFYLGHLKNFYTIQYNTIQFLHSVFDAVSWVIWPVKPTRTIEDHIFVFR